MSASGGEGGDAWSRAGKRTKRDGGEDDMTQLRKKRPRLGAADDTTLASTDHASSVLNVMNDLRRDENLCDVVVRSGDTKIAAHRVVLAGCSEYFRAALAGTMKESGQREISLDCVDGETLRVLIDFAYTGQVNVSEGTVVGLLVAANQLEMTDITALCCEYLRQSMGVENALGILQIAGDYGCATLHEEAERFVFRHFERISKEREFLSIGCDQLAELLSADELSVSSEKATFTAVESWVAEDVEARAKHIARLLKCVRFELLPSTYIANSVHFSPLLKHCEASRDLLLDAYQWHCNREERKDLRPFVRKRAILPLLFTVGGDNGHDDRNPFDRTWFYHPHLGKWETCAPMHQARSVCGVAVVGNRMFVMGGYDGERALDSVEVFDISRNEWHRLSPMRQRRCSCAAAVLDGQVYVVGGVCGPHALQDVERYDPAADRWVTCTQMLEGRSGCGLAAVNGKLYAVGGINTHGETVSSAEVYDPQRDCWRRLESMNSPRRSLGLVAVGDALYAIGGNDGARDLGSVECLDTSSHSKRWRDRGAMQHARMYCHAVEHDGMVYVIGGLSGSETLPQVEKFDPQGNKWTVHSKFDDAICGSAAAVLDAVPSVDSNIGDCSLALLKDANAGPRKAALRAATRLYRPRSGNRNAIAAPAPENGSAAAPRGRPQRTPRGVALLDVRFVRERAARAPRQQTVPQSAHQAVQQARDQALRHSQAMHEQVMRRTQAMVASRLEDRINAMSRRRTMAAARVALGAAARAEVAAAAARDVVVAQVTPPRAEQPRRDLGAADIDITAER